ncbi:MULTISPECIES: GNAT family N-acetyltransferase [Lactococcus]|nr:MULTISPECIES: GNAT family N-acetyltransferase [Lactococcus]HAP15897.1 GNAT family N-acetyltransferase [Lactococcus sp.]
MEKITYDYAKISDLGGIMHIETTDFSPNEASSRESMLEQIERISDSFLVAHNERGTVVGYVAGPVTAGHFVEDRMFEHSERNPNFYGYQKITSLAVHPDYQGQGIAKELMSRFIEQARLKNRRGVSLTCHDYLVGYYERYGFVNKGISESQWGGEIWYDMTLELRKSR